MNLKSFRKLVCNFFYCRIGLFSDSVCTWIILLPLSIGDAELLHSEVNHSNDSCRKGHVVGPCLDAVRRSQSSFGCGLV